MRIHRRSIALFCAMILLFTVCIWQLHYVNTSDYLAAAAEGQGHHTLNIAQTRGGIYDRQMRLLVNNQSRLIASVLPTPEAMVELYRVLPEERRPAVMELLRAGLPFALELDTPQVDAPGIDVFELPERFGNLQFAPHLIGYLSDGTGIGVTGIERAFDDILRESGGSVAASFLVDAAGRAMPGGGVSIQRQNETHRGGVVLTLDADIQFVTQRALAEGAERGAAVVMEIETGNILAMASLPSFDQNNIAASLNSLDAPFINRAMSGHSIGSVFKGVISAGAIESGFSSSYTFNCAGYINIGGQIFRCNNYAVHGLVDMSRAMQVSCNTYFINLGLQLDPAFLLTLTTHLTGMGTSTQLAPGMFAHPGNLPTLAELQNPAALANFSFGQGSSLATPLQLTRMMSVFAGGGRSVTPRLVEGITENGITLSSSFPQFADTLVISPATAAALYQIMVDVVELGSGWPATPIYGGAGGKTSSAQTGQWVEDEDGELSEVIHAWFSGFYPAVNPRYSITVFVEGGHSGEQVAAPIFATIADGIYIIQNSNPQRFQ